MLLSNYKDQREQRLASIYDNGKGDRDRFWRSVEEAPALWFAEIRKFLKKLEGVEFNHPGLTSAQYMSHCYRVAGLILNNHHSPGLLMIKLALCHNIFETSSSSEKMATLIGPNLTKKVSVLTVNRPLQWDNDYKATYYEEVSRCKVTAAVKIYDKLDNIYLLSNNPDVETKIKYLAEFHQFVIPLAEKHAPTVAKVLNELYQKNLTLLNPIRG